MGKLMVQDDCLVPEKYVWLTYSGPDPWGVVKRITDSIRGFFHVSASGTSHERLNWDMAGDPILFWSRWWVKKTMSKYTYAVIWVWVQGTKSKVENTGQFTLRLNGELITELTGPAIFLKPFWLTYSYLFYDRARRRFLERCRDLTLNFRNQIKEHYNMGITKVPQAHTVFGS